MARYRAVGKIWEVKLMNRKYGMTLMEVLIALFIIAIGVAVLVSFHGELLQGAGISHQQSIAITLAEKKISELQHFTVLDTTVGATAYEDLTAGTTNTTVNHTTYTVTWAVTENTAPDYKTIKVTVSWTDPKNVSQSVVLESIVGKVDPDLSGQIMEDI
ncbi:MAG: prepilin-type N-terminal cleavage/methylation domain-containing protein [Gammaproteobacteria bacterium]|nr:prepilin-type N-terminal cleavage/methylation domain-containing protein [Gammaproteobacteria bacterium]